MAYVFQDDIAGLQPIAEVASSRRSPAVPGMLAHAVDPTEGGGEFVYLQGVANTVAGSLVTYDQLSAATVLAATGAQRGAPVAVAMAAIGAGQFGWYQVTGNARIAKTAVAGTLGAPVGLSGTPGQVAPLAGGAAPATNQLTNAVINAAASAGDARAAVQINRPMVG